MPGERAVAALPDGRSASELKETSTELPRAPEGGLGARRGFVMGISYVWRADCAPGISLIHSQTLIEYLQGARPPPVLQLWPQTQTAAKLASVKEKFRSL